MTRKTNFFEGCSWFKFNNLGLALGTALKVYTSVAKGLKLKVRKFWWIIPTFAEVTREKLVRAFLPPIFNGVKIDLDYLTLKALWSIWICIQFLPLFLGHKSSSKCKQCSISKLYLFERSFIPRENIIFSKKEIQGVLYGWENRT